MSQAVAETKATEGGEHYVSAFEASQERWSSNGKSWLSPLRSAAIEQFRAIGFPSSRHEDWRHTNLKAFAKTPFAPASDRGRISEASAAKISERMVEFTFGDMPCIRLTFVNGRLAPDFSSYRALPEGVNVCGFAEAGEDQLDRLAANLGRVADITKRPDRPFLALNTALHEDGAFIHVAAGVRLDVPIHLLYLTDSEGAAPLATFSRNLILVDDGASVSIVESHRALGAGSAYFTSSVTEVVVGEGAEVETCKMQRESRAAWHMASLFVRQGAGSRFSQQLITLGAARSRNEATATLNGSGAHCAMNSVYLLDGDQVCDNRTRMEHMAPDCTSHQLYKAILDGNSTGVFNGRIFVDRIAQLTDAVQSSRGLLLSEGARNVSEPQLEIYADDVKCTHGATVGRLDEDAIFYMQSRGISAADAQRLLTVAFANEVTDEIRIDPIRERFANLFIERLSRLG